MRAKGEGSRKKDRNGFFTLGRPSNILKSVGIPDAPIQLHQSKAVNMMRKHPDEINSLVLKAIPAMLESPVVIAEFIEGNAYVFGDIY